MNSAVSPDSMAALTQWIGQRMGLSDLERKRDELSKAMLRAAAEAKAASLQAFLDDLLRDADRDPQALLRVVPHLTVGETYFFRDTALFDALEHIVLPERLQAVAGRPLRLWSAACSTGEEAYSLAASLGRVGGGTGHRIVATDLNPRSIAHARARVYRDWSLRGVAANVRAQMFDALPDGRWHLRADVARQVEFEVHNLLDAVPPRALGGEAVDVIFCRNILIYLEPWAAERVLQHLFDQLVEGGWLFVAAVESFLVPTPPAEVVQLGEAFGFRKLARGKGAWAALPEWPAAVSWPPIEPSPSEAPGLFGMPTQGPWTEPGPRAVAPEATARPGTDKSSISGALRNSAEHDISALYRAGQQACAIGDVALAAKTWRKVLFLDHGHVVAQVALGRMWRDHGRRTEAARALRHALRTAGNWSATAELPDGDGLTAGALLSQIRALLAEVEGHV